MVGLSLTPNEVIGYRIKPDWYSFNVVLVKRHGASSKNAGQEYDKTLAYCRDVRGALKYIYLHSLRTRAEVSQAEHEALHGSIASLEALAAQVDLALEDVRSAAKDLEERIKNLGLSHKALVKAMGTAEDTPSTDNLAD